MKRPSKNISSLCDRLRSLTYEGDWEEKVSQSLILIQDYGSTRTTSNLISLLSDVKHRDSFLNIIEPFLTQLIDSADPDRAFNNFERFIQAYPQKDRLYGRFIDQPQQLSLLIELFSKSQALSDTLIQNPLFFDWLISPETEKCFENEDSILSIGLVYSKELAGLHEFKKKFMVYIASRDFLGLDPFHRTVELISQMASVSIEMAYRRAWIEMVARFGEPIGDSGVTSTFAILGLGKLGGYELNYASDIDIIFVYSEDGQTSGKKNATRGGEGVVPNSLFFTKLAERILAVLSDRSAGRPLFRVDTRLRPEGHSGPLVRSLESYELYYSSLGRSWEKQAMIKTRCVAGDSILGNRFIQLIEPFVYRKYVDYKTVNDLQRIKKRIEEEVKRKGQTETHVKLGTGGIREIEFSVQMLQLLYGGKIKSLRESNTLKCLKRLSDADLITDEEYNDLCEAYIFLRRIEHLLQLEEERQTHVMPTDELGMKYLAKRMGFREQPELTLSLSYGVHRQKVQQFFKKIFFEWEEKGDQEKIMWMKQIDEDPALREDVRDKLVSLGIQNPVKALENIKLMGRSDQELPVTSDIRNRFVSILPRILNSIYAAWDPDAALARLPQFIDKYYARKTFFELLGQYNHVVDLLVCLFGSGDLLSQKLIQNPYLFDSLIGEGYLVEPYGYTEKFISPSKSLSADRIKAQLYEKYALEILKIGLRYVVKMDDISKTHRALSQLSEQIIKAICHDIIQEFEETGGHKLPPLVILGLGKLGTQELSFGSDLDLLFVCQGGAEESSVAEEFIKKLIEVIGHPLYQVDVRLRPHGDQGSLVPTLEQCKTYYAKRSDLWERMAMSRFRLIWGHQELAKEISALLHDFIYRKGVGLEDMKDMLQLRTRIEQDRVKYPRPNLFYIKASQGSLLDIEFLLQVLNLAHSEFHAQISNLPLLDQIETFRGRDILSSFEAHMLRSAYLFYREVEGVLRIITGKSTESLEEGSELLLKVERGIGVHQKGTYLWKELKIYQNKVSEIFKSKTEKIMASI